MQVYVETAGGSGPERGASGRVRPERGGQSGKRGGASRQGAGRETKRPREVLELRRTVRRVSMMTVPHRASRTAESKAPRMAFVTGRPLTSNCRTNAARILCRVLLARLGCAARACHPCGFVAAYSTGAARVPLTTAGKSVGPAVPARNVGLQTMGHDGCEFASSRGARRPRTLRAFAARPAQLSGNPCKLYFPTFSLVCK